MTVATTNTSTTLTGDGSSLVFPFTFRVQSTSDIDVYVNEVLISTGLYTVTINSNGVGGTITFNPGQAPANNAQVRMARDMALTQDLAPPVDGDISEASLENAYDRAILLIQQLQEQLNRTFKLDMFNTYSGSFNMSDPAPSTVPFMNAGGTAVEWVSASTLALSLSTANTRLVKMLGWKAPFVHTISANAISPLAITNTNSTATITIGTTGTWSFLTYQDGSGNVLLADGEFIITRADTGNTVTVNHNQAPGALQLKLITQDGLNLTLSGNKSILWQRFGTELREVSRAGFNNTDSVLLRLGGSNAATSPRPLLNIPAAPTVTVVGTTGATTRSYAITDGDPFGTETSISANGSVANANGTLGVSNFCRIQFPTVLGRIYKVYRTVASGTPSSTGLIATVTGTGGTVTVDDTNLSATTAAPTVHTWKGTYEHIGNYTLDDDVTGTEVRIRIIGDLNLGGTAFTYTGVAPFTGPTQNIETRHGYQGAGLSPGISGGYVDTSGVYGASGAGNGGAGGRGASSTASGGIPGACAIPLEIFCTGSTGATCGTYTTKGGNAGDAGASLYIECYGALTFCNINLAGGNGAAGSSSNDPGGSGGSGGTIYACAKTALTIAASVTINLNGGNGGNGGSGGAARYGGGGGGGGKGLFTCEDSNPINNGSVTTTGGTAGTSTSAATTAQAGSAGVTRIIRQAMMRLVA